METVKDIVLVGAAARAGVPAMGAAAAGFPAKAGDATTQLAIMKRIMMNGRIGRGQFFISIPPKGGQSFRVV